MLPTANPIVMALAAAYCASASPTKTKPDYVQEVINALKVQLEADNVTDASAMIEEAEASLWANGVLDSTVAANLKQEIQTMTTEAGISVDAIAGLAIQYLNAKGAFKKTDQDEAANKTIFLETAVIKQVLDHGVSYMGGPCLGNSQSQACCVIL